MQLLRKIARIIESASCRSSRYFSQSLLTGFASGTFGIGRPERFIIVRPIAFAERNKHSFRSVWRIGEIVTRNKIMNSPTARGWRISPSLAIRRPDKFVRVFLGGKETRNACGDASWLPTASIDPDYACRKFLGRKVTQQITQFVGTRRISEPHLARLTEARVVFEKFF